MARAAPPGAVRALVRSTKPLGAASTVVVEAGRRLSERQVLPLSAPASAAGAWWHTGVHGPGHQLVAFGLPQRQGEHALRDARDRTVRFTELPPT